MQFDGVPALSQRLAAAGFEDVRVQTVPGWQQHIVYTFLGRRPAVDETAIDDAIAAGVPPVDPDAATPPQGIEVPAPAPGT
jgi:hypothetical protein